MPKVTTPCDCACGSLADSCDHADGMVGSPCERPAYYRTVIHDAHLPSEPLRVSLCRICAGRAVAAGPAFDVLSVQLEALDPHAVEQASLPTVADRGAW